MKKIKDLSNTLKDIGLLKEAELIDKNLDSLISMLEDIEKVIGEEIVKRASEKKFNEIAKLSEIPAKCQECKEYIQNSINGIEVEKTEEVLREDIKKYVEAEYLAEQNINNEDNFFENVISETDDENSVELKVGSELEHLKLGVGRIAKIGVKEGSSEKVIVMSFPNGNQTIECTPENLEKCFGIIKEIDFKTGKVSYKRVKDFNRGFSLYTAPEYFTHRKPVIVEIFGHQYRATNWRDAAFCVLSVFYKKYPKTVTKALKADGNFSLTGKDLSVGLSLSGDEKGPYFEASKSAMDMMKMLAMVAEYLTPVMKKDVRKNVLVYLKRK